MQTNSPDVVIAMRLLDHAKLRGFEFLRVAPGEDGPTAPCTAWSACVIACWHAEAGQTAGAVR